MTPNRPGLYRSRPQAKWRMLAAFAAAAGMHLSAVLASFHRLPPADLPGTPIDAIDVQVEDPDIRTPEPQEVQLPPPPDLVSPPEFAVDAATPPPRTNRIAAAVYRREVNRIGNTRVGAGKISVLSAPRPEYPYQARSRHITGSGVALLTVDQRTGSVVQAAMGQSTGNPILDSSALSAFRRWRFKPGTPPRVRVPITFLITGSEFSGTPAPVPTPAPDD